MLPKQRKEIGRGYMKFLHEHSALSQRVFVGVSAIFVALCVICAPSLACASSLEGVSIEVSHVKAPGADVPTAYSWYGMNMSLINRYESPSYFFDGNNVGIEMTCSSATQGTFTVELQRRVSYNRYESLGTASFDRNGFTKATWEGVGSGTYRFVFSKASDGVWVTSSDVALYSW